MDRGDLEPCDGVYSGIPGCANCYAKTFAERFRGVAKHPYEMGFDLTLRPERIEQPLSWRRPRTIFVNSMSDLFHEAVPLSYVNRVFEVMAAAHWHTFQVLTKRSERLRKLAGSLPWPANVWMGVSVENQHWTPRIDDLRAVPAAIRFLSCEPLLSTLDLDLQGIDWVIAGGESGPGARPMNLEWHDLSGTNASRPRHRFSSSSGACTTNLACGSGNTRQDDFSTGGPGTLCRRVMRFSFQGPVGSDRWPLVA